VILLKCSLVCENQSQLDMALKIRSLALAFAVFIAGYLTLAINASSTEAKPPYITLSLSLQLFPVGKWAEGIAATKQGIWVSESGQRTILLLNARTGRVIRRVNVGRIPVEIAAGSADSVWGLSQTDRIIWLQPAQGLGKSLRGEPLRVCRRPFCLSHAALAVSSTCA